MVYVPFAKDSAQQIGAVLAVKLSNPDTTYRMLYADKYAAFGFDSTKAGWSAKDVFHLFTSMDYHVFGHRTFLVKDGRLLGRKKDSPPATITIKEQNGQPLSGRTAGSVYEECTTYYGYTYCPAARTAMCVDYVQIEICTIWYDYSGDSGGWTGSGDGTGGGGTGGGSTGNGGSGSWTAGEPCNQQARESNTDPCQSGWVSVATSPKDPCITARQGATKATELAATSVFQQAKASIQLASANVEHAIAFGRDGGGNVIASTIQSGGNNHGSVPAMPAGFADIHNHPGNTEPSAGDLYSLIAKNTPTNAYNTRFVITGGTVYAFVVTDPVLADLFEARFPAQQIGNYPPDFPLPIFDEYKDISLWFQGNLGYSPILAEALGMASVFEKYNAGIAVLRQEPNGSFKILKTKQSSTSGTLGSYEEVLCN